MNMINEKSLVLGLMSGTSLDGVDISCARYYRKNDLWKFDLIAADTFSYDLQIKKDLLKTFNKQIDLGDMDIRFTHVLVNYITIFLKKYNLDIDLISSHGHTIFYNPANNYTKQLGLGCLMSKSLNVSVVSNFRQQDIELGGQGAPLVPIGDKLLFSNYHACLNLGGIANISFDVNNNRYAYDICPCNMILNHLSNQLGEDFDNLGLLACSGRVNHKLLDLLNSINYYNFSFPKSLGKEYIDDVFFPIINSFDICLQDKLCTFVEHIAIQITNTFSQFNINNCFFTGGGVFNNYLISRIKGLSATQIIIPSKMIVNFKESIVFGFLGVLRVLKLNNCLASATGASKNHSSGDIYVI